MVVLHIIYCMVRLSYEEEMNMRPELKACYIHIQLISHCPVSICDQCSGGLDFNVLLSKVSQ